MLPRYSWLWQIKAIILALIICIGFYAIDNSTEEGQIFRNVEDYLQFFTPIYAMTIAFFYQDSKASAKQLVISLTVVMVVTHIIKNLVKATRPNGGRCSFPSGHTAFAFAAAMMIHKRYNWQYAIPAYINAILVGYLRVFNEKHFPRDVIFAAIMALIMTWFLVSRRHSAET